MMYFHGNSIFCRGGCFWCITPTFKETEGVLDVVSGYSGGGDEADPAYIDVKTQKTGYRGRKVPGDLHTSERLCLLPFLRPGIRRMVRLSAWDGKPTAPPCKGHTYKGPFHAMRMLARCMPLLQE